MKIRELHDWDLTPAKAKELQLKLREKLIFTPYKVSAKLAVGADCGYDLTTMRATAGLVVYAVPSLKEVERVWAVSDMNFPYVPGLLSFREAPALLAAFRKLKSEPDAAFFDAHGIAHPRGFGLACHMGLWLGIPTIGVAKSVLIGTHRTPASGFGSTAPLLHQGEQIGTAFRAGECRRPVYVSPGHLIDMKSAMRLTRAVCDGQRVPKPTREADRYVRELMRS
ncbi:MAG: endonuclease V [Elusimicrobiota bacterium]